jgi:hypothetical protein
VHAGMLDVWLRMLSEEYGGALVRGFRFANDLGCSCGPAHLLVGIAEGDGAAAGALIGTGLSLREVVTADGAGSGLGAMYLNTQVQRAARTFVEQLAMVPTAEHLLVAVLDQGTPQVLTVLAAAGIDPAAARAAALVGLGLGPDLPLVLMPALTPAGTLDRPPLPIAELDNRAWAVLCWRQDHLPLQRLRGRSSWQGLWSVEYRTAWRLPTRLGLDDDQRYSLLDRHRRAVEDRLALARPDLAPVRKSSSTAVRPLYFTRHRRWRRRLRFLSFVIGWPSWFANRRAGIRDRWFWFTTLPHYRHAPRL